MFPRLTLRPSAFTPLVKIFLTSILFHRTGLLPSRLLLDEPLVLQHLSEVPTFEGQESEEREQRPEALRQVRRRLVRRADRHQLHHRRRRIHRRKHRWQNHQAGNWREVDP